MREKEKFNDIIRRTNKKNNDKNNRDNNNENHNNLITTQASQYYKEFQYPSQGWMSFDISRQRGGNRAHC